jgi:hypothetical protein
MVTDRTYAESLAMLNPDQTPWTSNDDLLEALKKAGRQVEVRIRPDIKSLRDSVLVVWYRIGSEKYFHTVVWDAQRQTVLDPFEDRPFEEYVRGLCLAFELV